MGKLIVANWKMNPLTLKEALALAVGSDDPKVVICPPFTFLSSVGSKLKKAKLGAQDVFWEERGARTGEISPKMLKGIGVKYVIIGHSERRAMGEKDKDVNAKVKAALYSGLKPIVCVGEPGSVRKKGMVFAKQYVSDQLSENLKDISEKVIVAYEPIWAIGTGVPDKPEDSAEMARYIKTIASVSMVLYGGSVKPENARGFLSRADINGALVGGASLDKKSFKNIIDASRK